MKKLLLGLLAFQLFYFAVYAQIEKGSIMLGGNVNFNNSNSEQLIGMLPNVTPSMMIRKISFSTQDLGMP
ncbi:hypothetical protein [Algoriphagus sp. NG3]|uniref:hypothetical protein n=1 Tax=Algoriphagus sp. NG3 TaxID=3097546 RepID=UPI002A820C6C|nr:hypothetical protein [Algoriphagus sp. NG3]WPR74791.1 hypothetical protein SLW71_19175 [Algoriphagus sp. NG3]